MFFWDLINDLFVFINLEVGDASDGSVVLSFGLVQVDSDPFSGGEFCQADERD
jgi:hypothetical protein